TSVQIVALHPTIGVLVALPCLVQSGLFQISRKLYGEIGPAELARVRVAQQGHLMGFLYIGGHVRAYHGKRACAPSRRSLSCRVAVGPGPPAPTTGSATALANRCS